MAADRIDARLADLRHTIRRSIADLAIAPESAARFIAIADRLRMPHRIVATGNRLPVARWWQRALAAASPAHRACLAELAPRLVWTQNPNYRRRPSPPFLSNYGYAAILGANDGRAVPVIVEPSAALGLLMLGPATLYPPHRHPAEEIYIPLAGTADWQRGDAAWQRVAPGIAIHHPSGIPHATRTGGQPLVALYLWHGAVSTPATLLDPA